MNIVGGLVMEKSKVYYTDFHAHLGEGLPTKLKRLVKKAGIAELELDGKFVAIKMHFGELGNISYLRPNYAKAIVDVVKELGGKPFLTDCNTMYPGSRKNALEHLECLNTLNLIFLCFFGDVFIDIVVIEYLGYLIALLCLIEDFL